MCPVVLQSPHMQLSVCIYTILSTGKEGARKGGREGGREGGDRQCSINPLHTYTIAVGLHMHMYIRGGEFLFAVSKQIETQGE